MADNTKEEAEDGFRFPDTSRESAYFNLPPVREHPKSSSFRSPSQSLVSIANNSKEEAEDGFRIPDTRLKTNFYNTPPLAGFSHTAQAFDSTIDLSFVSSDSDGDDLDRRKSSSFEHLPGLQFNHLSPSTELLNSGVKSFRGYFRLPPASKDFQGKIRPRILRENRRFHPVWRAKEIRMMLAVSLNNVIMVESLLMEGIDPNVQDTKNRSGLHIAASKGYIDCVNLLLEYGANPNQKDGIGNTALHLAVCASHIPVITALLKAGTDINSEDNEGFSALQIASSKLKLIQRAKGSVSQEVKDVVYQVIDMMHVYLKKAGRPDEVDLLESLTGKLSLSDSKQDLDNEVQQLLDSLEGITLKVKEAS